jgi:hypothetical protein
MSTNWRTPKSEKLLAWEARAAKCAAEIRAKYPNIGDDAMGERLRAIPDLAPDEALEKELFLQATEEVLDEDCFIYGPEKRIIEDKKLLRMTNRQLAAWAQKTGVMFAQLKAHLAERFPEAEGEA